MTVEDIETEDDGVTRVYCVWFDDKNEHKTMSFAAETLER